MGRWLGASVVQVPNTRAQSTCASESATDQLRLRHAVASEDDDEETDDNSRAAEEKEAFSDAYNTIPLQCALLHPIVYETWNPCAMISSNKLSQLTVAQLREICSHFNMEDAPSGHRKKPYPDFILNLVGACSCASSNQ